MTIKIDELQLSYGLTADQLVLTDADLTENFRSALMDNLCEIVGPDWVRHDPDAASRTLNMALALFLKVRSEPQTESAYYIETFEACLEQAMIWEVG